MKSKKVTPAPVKRETSEYLFDKTNYSWMLIAAAVLILGCILMAGGRNADPNVFDRSAVYSTVRITIAPFVILAGFVLGIVAIFRHPKNS